MQQTKEPTVYLAGQDLAEYLEVTAQSLSRAVRRDYNAAGYRVSEWADWHHNRRRIEGYDVPRSIARKIIPKDQWEDHKIAQATETVRLQNPRPLPLDPPPKDAAEYAAHLLRTLEGVEELEELWLDTVASELERFSKTEKPE